MKKLQTFALTAITCVSVAGLCSNQAFAAQNVANTSQKGSLLIWPLVSIDPTNSQDTLIEISNDGIQSVHIECSYINEKKGRANFDFDLSAKQTASWDVGTLNGDHANPAAFPLNGTYTGNGADQYRGELACFATDEGAISQVPFNELTGTATVMSLAVTGARETREAFRYNAWAFAARGASGLAPDDPSGVTQQGTPGILELTGGGVGTYDACPVYNIGTFMPNGAALGNLTTTSNSVAVVSCWQDLRENFTIHLTKLAFTTWNSNENSFSGSYECADSVETVPLTTTNKYLAEGGNFAYSTLQTPNARLMVQGVGSSPVPCAGSASAGLLGVIESWASISPFGGPPALVDVALGSNMQGAGATPGVLLWDPASGPPPAVKSRK